MTEFLSWAVAILTLLAAAAGFVDFLLDDGGRQRVGQRLESWYVTMEEGKWDDLRFWIVGRLDDFLTVIFGKLLLSFRAVFISLFVAFFYVSVYSVLSGLRSSLDDPTTTLEVYGSYAVAEVVSILLIRAAIRSSRRHNPSTVIPLLVIIPHLVGALFLWATEVPIALMENTNILETLRRTLSLVVSTPHSYMLVALFTLATPELAIATAIKFQDVTLAIVFLMPAFTSLSILSIIALVWLVPFSKRWTKAPLMLLVDRLAHAPKGAFAVTALGISATITVLKAFLDTMQH